MQAATSRSRELILGLSYPTRLGEILLQAGLLSDAQIAVALRDQEQFADMLLGEVLALRGWLKQQTADFFVEQWPSIICRPMKLRLGDYFKASALLDEEQLSTVSSEQGQTGLRFGSAAVLLGFIKQPTLDFFLMYLYPEECLAGSLVKKRAATLQEKRSSPRQD